jgi:carbamoyltransferase
MIVLGIHDGHDSGAALLKDGKELTVSVEERRRNIKNYVGVPEQSLRALFERTGIRPQDVDLIALSGLVRTTPPTSGYKPMYGVLGIGYRLAKGQAATSAGRWVLSKMRKRHDLMKFLGEMGLGDKPVVPYDHHLTHAACAYYHKPWEGKTLVLTVDGAGDGLCATVSVAEGHEIKRIARTPKYHSIAAWMYSFITGFLGMKISEHEYKVMGMAPYGQAERCAPILRKMFGVEGLEFRNYTGKVFYGMQKYYQKKLAGQRFDNVSAACQLVFEELMTQWVKNCIAATGVHKVACAGGAFLNVKANKMIRELPEVEAFYAYPASDDGGTPIGAAILGYVDLCKKQGVQPNYVPSRTMYLGLDFTEAEMESAIRDSGLPYERMTDGPKQIGQLLAEGKIIARFDGREEIGPRSLGNRTIMADPRDLRNIRKLNFAIKYRDFWMPFAASILDEDATKYIKNMTGWPYYMIEAFDTMPAAESAILAGMHPMDMTVRPQVVTEEHNPGYRAIIKEFKNLTGVGGILNTSFNLHGFPIVGTPAVAIYTLVHSDLDGLALGPFLITKPPKAA